MRKKFPARAGESLNSCFKVLGISTLLPCPSWGKGVWFFPGWILFLFKRETELLSKLRSSLGCWPAVSADLLVRAPGTHSEEGPS